MRPEQSGRTATINGERRSRSRGDCLSVLDGGWLSLRHANSTDLVRVDAIISLHTTGNNTLVVTATERHRVSAPLSTAVSKIEAFGVVRIHRSMAVNLSRVRRLVSRGQHRLRIVLDTGEEIEVGRTFQRAVRARLGARAQRTAR